MSLGRLYDVFIDRFNRSIPVVGIIFFLVHRPKRIETEQREDDAYASTISELGESPAFAGDSMARLKTVMLGELLAHIAGIGIFGFMFYKGFHLFFACLVATLSASVADLVLGSLAGIIHDRGNDSVLDAMLAKDKEEEDKA
jgi:hypothetical protein